TDRKGRVDIQEHVDERGLAPVERIGRMVEGVLQRVEDELSASPPRSARIAGDPDHWRELLESLRTDPRWGGAARQYVNTTQAARPDPGPGEGPGAGPGAGPAGGPGGIEDARASEPPGA
ncbi:MAG TPA: hypothetical protein VJ957_04460, partial [Longimicrobiales bacterium]|nr:hypothetical protein [Longimicrobiales bacterium]